MNSRSLTDTFIKYTAVSSQSCSANKNLPSTLGQMKLAELLKSDLESFGIKDIELQENAILIAKIPRTDPMAPAISFMSHIDTVDIGESPHVNAQILRFEGKNIVLNEDKNIVFNVTENPEIQKFQGEEIIFTDGTSVLGADDKAGVAIMMETARFLMNNTIKHGDIYLVFVPDEEIGLCGAYALDLTKIPVRYSYTIDGGHLGELGYETFNGASAVIDIQGVSVHPGTAKGILVNPILVAHDLIAQTDRRDTPEYSEDKEGFFLITDISGGVSSAQIQMIIRDFDLQKFEERKHFLETIIVNTRKKHPKAIINMTITDSYANIANNLSEDRSCVDLVLKAMGNLNINPDIKAIRGGTDGAVLSAKGLITPNLCTGAHRIHSVFEFLPVSEFVKSFDLVLEIIRCSISFK